MLTLNTTPETVEESITTLLRASASNDKNGQRIGMLLLSLYAGNKWRVDAQELTYLPPGLRTAVLHLMHFLLRTGKPFSELISCHHIDPVMRTWGIVEEVTHVDYQA